MQPKGLALVNLFVRSVELVDLFGIFFAAVGRFSSQRLGRADVGGSMW